MPRNTLSSIRNIVSGTLGSPNVNVVVSVGEKILADMKDRSVSDYSFKTQKSSSKPFTKDTLVRSERTCRC